MFNDAEQQLRGGVGREGIKPPKLNRVLIRILNIIVSISQRRRAFYSRRRLSPQNRTLCSATFDSHYKISNYVWRP